VVALLAVRFVDESVAFLPFGALDAIRADLDLTYAQAGLLLTLYPAAGFVGAVFGVAADRVSRRALASCGALGYGAALLAFALGDSFAVLAVAIVGAGLASDAMVAGTEVALADLAGDGPEGDARLRTLLARQNVLAAVGDLLGPLLLAASLAVGLGWRGAFTAGAAMLFIYGAALAVLPLPPPGPHDGANADARRPSVGRAVVDVMLDRRVLAIAAALFLLALFDEPFFGFAIAWLHNDRGVPESTATLIAGASTIGGLVLALAVAAGRRRTPGPIAGAGVIAAGAIGLLLARGPLGAAAATFAVGFGLYALWIDLQARSLRVRPGQAGTTGAVLSVLTQPAAVLPLLAGAVADAHGLTAVMVVCAGAALALVGAASMVVRTSGAGIDGRVAGEEVRR
jgi:DHA1 family inner membrane transport protein